MRSFLLIVFGWPLLLFLLLSGLQLAQHYGLLPAPPAFVPARRFVPRDGRARAATALRKLDALSVAERAAVLAGLRRDVIPLDRWLARLAREPPTVLCLGEDHLDATRGFVAAQLLPRLHFDGLMLEATPRELTEVASRVAAGERRAELLGADAAVLLRAVRMAHPAVPVRGIDETVRQRSRRERRAPGTLRDGSLAQNFWSLYEPGKHYVVLFGALHCTPRRGWLYGRLLRGSRPGSGVQAVAVRVIGAGRNEPTRAFVGFLVGSGLASPDTPLVIEHADALETRIRKWFPILRPSWESYRTVIIYPDPSS